MSKPKKKPVKPKPRRRKKTPAQKLAAKRARQRKWVNNATPKQLAARKKTQKKYTDKRTRQGQEIGKIPPVADPARRAAAERA